MKFSFFIFIINLISLSAFANTSSLPTNIDWPSYGSDNKSSSYSEAHEISAENVQNVEVKWVTNSPDNEKVGIANNSFNTSAKIVGLDKNLRVGPNQNTPLMVNGYLYLSTSLGEIIVLDPASGKNIANFDSGVYNNDHFYDSVSKTYKYYPPNIGYVHRGVSFAEFDGQKALLFGTSDGRLISLDANFTKKTNEIVPLKKKWEVDLTKGLRRDVPKHNYSVTSAPGICGDVVVVGASIRDLTIQSETPPGDVRAYNLSDGKLAWQFHTIPESEKRPRCCNVGKRSVENIW